MLEILPFNIPNIVQCTVLDGHASQLNCLHTGQWSDLAGAAHIPAYRLQNRCGFFRLEFIGHRPARKLVRVPQHLADAEIRYLDDRPIDQVVEAGTALFDLSQLLGDLIKLIEISQIRIDLKPVGPQKIHHFLMVGKL
ncbi:hypothetical protein D3C75_777030 [compost metagenome]